jgi:hypothetical protein
MIILPPVPTDPDNPRVGWHNFVAAASLEASTEADGFAVVNLRNPSTYQEWRATSGAAQTLVASLGSAQEVDYIGLARHNFGAAGIGYVLEGSNNGTSWTAITSHSPADNGIIVHEFAPVTFSFYRLSLDSGSVAARLAVWYLGRVLRLERRIYVGHTPLPRGRRTTVSTGRSESGQFLGRVVRRQFFETTIKQQNVDPAFYASDVEDFLEAADADTPFFWAWRPQAYPTHVGYVWGADDSQSSNQRPNGMVQFELAVQGIVE